MLLYVVGVTISCGIVCLYVGGIVSLLCRRILLGCMLTDEIHEPTAIVSDFKENEDVEEFVQGCLDSLLIVKVQGRKNSKFSMIGHAIAISPTLAVCSLHLNYHIGTEVSITTNKGIKLYANIVYCGYEYSVKDIAILKLSAFTEFAHYIPVATTPVQLLTELYIVGMNYQKHSDNSVPSIVKSYVSVIENKDESTFIHCPYVHCAVNRGAAIVTVFEDNVHKLVGIRVASHIHKAKSNSSPPGSGMKQYGTLESGSEQHHIERSCASSPSTKTTEVLLDDCTSIDSNTHGHDDYFLICEIARVEGLSTFLNCNLPSR